MKKILFLLLSTVSIYGQTLQNPTYGVVTEKNNASDSTPAYFVTSQTDGVHKKTPAALIALKADLPTTYTTVVYVNSTDPNSATIFDDVNPPVTNDPLLDNDTANLYIGTDASTWVYNGSTYITKTVSTSSNFKIVGTGVDAGSNKTSSIYREGSIGSNAFVSSNAGIFVNRNGSATAQNGGFFSFSNSTSSNSMMFQLNASNGLDLWNYASSNWSKRFAFSSGGEFKANKLYLEDVTASANYAAEDFEDIFFNSLRTTITPKNGTAVKSFAQKGSNSDGQIYFMVKSSENGTAGDNMLFGRTSGRVFIANAIDFSNAGAIHLGGSSWNNNDGIIILNGKNSDNSASIKLPTTPTTSIGAFRYLTYNETTDAVESVAQSDVNFWTKTGNNIYNNNIQSVFIGKTTNDYGFSLDLGLGVQGKVASNGGFRGNLSDIGEYAMLSGNFGETSIYSYDGRGVKLISSGNLNLLGTGIGNSFFTPINFTATSGDRVHNIFNINPTINQTGGANGITRGIYINPTLTSAADFRAIEVTAGKSMFQEVIANNVVRLKNYTVATLPTGTQGDTAYVTDALTPTYLVTVVGGGAVVTPVFYNGTSWVAH